MKTRRTYYKDYGITDDEAKHLKKICRETEDQEEKDILWNAAQLANKCLARQIYKSLREKQSYEKVDEKDAIYISREDFYGYQRLCILYFKNLMIFAGRYKTMTR